MQRLCYFILHKETEGKSIIYYIIINNDVRCAVLLQQSCSLNVYEYNDQNETSEKGFSVDSFSYIIFYSYFYIVTIKVIHTMTHDDGSFYNNNNMPYDQTRARSKATCVYNIMYEYNILPIPYYYNIIVTL